MKLDERMKQYEYVSRPYLTCRTPVIIRLDGRAFHTFTRGFNKPFDKILVKTMQDTMQYLCENISNCKFGYTQSDEISLLLFDNDNTETQAWFDNNLSKLVSVSASMATLAFNKFFKENTEEICKKVSDMRTEKFYETCFDKAMFDSRAFNIPVEEINNYFIWRQQDCIRNSIQMVGQKLFTHRELQNKNCTDIVEMLKKERNIDYHKDYPIYLKRGSCIYKTICTYTQVIVGEKTGYEFTEEVTRNRWKIDLQMPDLVLEKTFVKEKSFYD